MKHVILRAIKNKCSDSSRIKSKIEYKLSYEAVKPPLLPSKSITKSYSTKLLQEVIIESNEDDDYSDGCKDTANASGSKIIVNSTNASNVSHRDIHKIISTPTKYKSLSFSNKKVTRASEIVINGKTCR